LNQKERVKRAREGEERGTRKRGDEERELTRFFLAFPSMTSWNGNWKRKNIVVFCFNDEDRYRDVFTKTFHLD